VRPNCPGAHLEEAPSGLTKYDLFNLLRIPPDRHDDDTKPGVYRPINSWNPNSFIIPK
jgi:hypothetical protein